MHYFIFENKDHACKIVGHKGDFGKVACLAQQGTWGLVLRRSRAQLARTAPPHLVLTFNENVLVQ